METPKPSNDEDGASIKVIYDPARMRRRIEHALDMLLKITEGARNVMVGASEATTLLNLFRELQKPIPMLLFCPDCQAPHIDAPAPARYRYIDGTVMEAQAFADMYGSSVTTGWTYYEAWANPPHKSHECQACLHVWRPADIPTTGIAALATKGERDGSALPLFIHTVPPAAPYPGKRWLDSFAGVHRVRNALNSQWEPAP